MKKKRAEPATKDQEEVNEIQNSALEIEREDEAPGIGYEIVIGSEKN